MPDMQKGPTTAIIERLRELEKQATRSPWDYCPLGAHRSRVVERKQGLSVALTPTASQAIGQHIHDAALIAETRNLLPALLDCAEACRLLLDSYQTDDRGATSYGLGKLAEARAKATEALAALERAGK